MMYTKDFDGHRPPPGVWTFFGVRQLAKLAAALGRIRSAKRQLAAALEFGHFISHCWIGHPDPSENTKPQTSKLVFRSVLSSATA